MAFILYIDISHDTSGFAFSVLFLKVKNCFIEINYGNTLCIVYCTL